MVRIMSELSELPGVGPTTLEKLESAGITTKMALAVSVPSDISSLTGMSEASARKIIKAARDSLQLGFKKATEYINSKEGIKRVSTGCESLDNILGGGLESGSITEFYGPFGSGKTQLSHLMTVRVLAENEDNKAIYLDTEATFREERIRDFANALGLDPDNVLERIYIARAFSSEHQILLTDEIEKLLQEDNSYKIVIVDSLTSHFRSEYIGRGTLANRQQVLNKHMHTLLKIADLYNIPVLVTNQVMSKPDSFYGDPTVPIGGHIVGHASTTRVYMRPGKAGSVYAKMIDSPYLPNSDCNFYITKDGFSDKAPKK